VIPVPVSEILTTALAIVSIATLAGLGFLRGTVVSLRERLDDADKDVARYKAQRVEDRALIDSQAAKIQILESVVTGEAHWRELTHLLSIHHTQAETHWQKAEETMEHLLTTLADLVRGLNGERRL
jgi:hypothetical protein